MKISTPALIALAAVAGTSALIIVAPAPVSACAAAVPHPPAAVKVPPASFRLTASIHDGRGGYNDAPPWRAALPAGGSESITSRSCI